MIIRNYKNAVEFLTRVLSTLEENEIQNSLMLGLAQRLAISAKDSPDEFECRTIYRSVHDELGIIAITMQTPGRGLIVYQHRSDITDAFSMIVADYFQNHRDPIGVVGPKSTAQRFAQLWQVVSGVEPRVSHQRLFQCTAVTNFDLAPGKLRKAFKKEIPMLIDWSMEFSKETAENPTEIEVEKSLRRDIEEGSLYVWSEGSQAVSMLKKNRPTTNTIAISYVFTPKDLRSRGYATAAVHTLTSQLLKSGYSACTLFTDLSNPTSNKIYQKIGYTPVIDIDNYQFHPKSK